MLFREGDIVTLKGVVRGDQEPGETSVSITVGAGDGYRDVVVIADTSTLKLVVTAFRVGDRVSWKNGRAEPLTGDVVSMVGSGVEALLWIRADHSGRMDTLDAVLCTRLDPPVAPAAPPSMPAGGIGSWVKGEEVWSNWDRSPAPPVPGRFKVQVRCVGYADGVITMADAATVDWSDVIEWRKA